MKNLIKKILRESEREWFEDLDFESPPMPICQWKIFNQII